MADQVLVFEVADEQLADNDPRWDRQVQGLISDLKADVGQVTRGDGPSQPGMKGVPAADIILALGSAGALTAAVEVFKAWLGHGKRSIKIRTSKDGDVTVTGENISEALLSKAIDAAAARKPAS
jgi:hypothetical protein